MSKFNEARSLKEYADVLEYHARTGRNAKVFYYRHWYMDKFPWPERCRVLDAGAFVGASAIEWAKRGHSVTSIEACDIYCQHFRSNVQKHGVQVRLVQGLIEEFDEPGAYDVAVCTEIWGHFLKPEDVMAVLYRSLAPNGMVFVAQPQKPSVQDRQVITGEDLLRLMEGAGFKASVEPIDCGEHVAQNLGVGYV